MAKEIKPQDTTRATAYELWMKVPNPMVTIFKTVDVTNLVRYSEKKHLKFKYANGLLHRHGGCTE